MVTTQVKVVRGQGSNVKVPHLACSKFADESGEVASSDLAASKNN